MFDTLIHLLTWNWIGVIITLIWVMLLLNFATWKLEDQLSVVWKKLKMPASVRWATFDAVSSSLPEFLTAMIALILLKEKWLEVWIWTISWSAIFNILIIPFFALLFYKWKWLIKVSKWWINRDVLFYVMSIVIFLVWLYLNQLFIMWFVLIALYWFYLATLLIESRKHKNENIKEANDSYIEVKDIKISYFTIFYTLVLIYIWVELSVYSAQFIGTALWISTLVVALVLLAAITSIPDTLLSVKASQKGDIDASLSNAVWSNIFDICIALWLPIVIGIWFMWLDPQVDFSENFPIFVFLLVSVFVYLGVLSMKKITKKSWYILVSLYLIFIWYLVYISI